MSQLSAPWLIRIAPVIFVFLWATGFVGAKYGTSNAEPFTFLAYRFLFTTLLLLPITLFFFRSEFRKIRQCLHSALVGILLHAGYLGGVFYAVDQGLASGLSSLIVSLQPFATALLAWFVLGETLGVKRGVCFAVALIGVSMVLADGAGLSVGQQGITIENMVACLLAMVAISFGAVYQKRFVTDLNLLVSTNIQFAGAAFASFIVVLLFENGEIHWTNEVVFAMVWLVLVLSIGAVGLLMFLIRQGSSSSVASLFFLVPVVAMFMGWVLFGETLSLLQIAGSFLVIVGVAASSRIK